MSDTDACSAIKTHGGIDESDRAFAGSQTGVVDSGEDGSTDRRRCRSTEDKLKLAVHGNDIVSAAGDQ